MAAASRADYNDQHIEVVAIWDLSVPFTLARAGRSWLPRLAMANLSNDCRRRLVVNEAEEWAGWDLLDPSKVLLEPSIIDLFRACTDKSRSMMFSPKVKCRTQKPVKSNCIVQKSHPDS